MTAVSVGRERPSRAAPVRRDRPGAIWAAPATVFFIALGVLPIFGVVYLSLTSWNGLGSPQWVGLDNWRALTADQDVVQGIKITALLTGVSWLLQTPLSLLIGVWAAGPQRNRAVLSTLFFLPLLLSLAAIALMWLALFEPNFGVAGQLGKYVGVPDGNFLGHPTRALYCAAFVIAWQWIPFHTLIYQAGARQIPEVLYEAANLDGAGRVRQFFAITLPQLRNTVIASSVLMIVGSLTFFESIFLLTGGGPGNATQVLPLKMYQDAFISFNMGYASAIAVILVLVGTILSVVIIRATGFHRMSSEREGL